MKTQNENKNDGMRAALAAETAEIGSGADLRAGGAGERTKRFTAIAMLSAVSYIVMLLSHLIPITLFGFLKLDFSDIVTVIGGFIFGPLAALFISAVVSFVESITISSTGPIGFVMNILSTAAFACVAAFVYKRKQTMSGAVAALASGVLAMTAVMLLWNYIITPLYMSIPRAQVAAMLLTAFLPFNIVKGSINAALTLLLYKPLVTALRRARLVPSTRGNETLSQQRRSPAVVMIPAALVLITCVFFVLAWAGII
ncbi:MAG: ECF transporter S component [Clostridiales Family XIII bacterium]|nr:ECF transporter S component [Clostridiales Family XIII bacterium]